MKLAAYLRVSTDKQAEEGNGLAVQEAAIRTWARENGHKIAGWFRDEGESGSNGLDCRVGLFNALNAIKEGKADGIVVKVLDRFSREMVLQEQLFAMIKKDGGMVFSTSPTEMAFLNDDEADPHRKLVRVILGAVQEFERSMIRLRMASGKSAKRARGGYAGYGSPPFGQRSVDKELVPDAAEQAAVARIAELDAEGLSLREIVAVLEVEGIRAKRGGGWSPSTVRRVLARARNRS